MLHSDPDIIFKIIIGVIVLMSPFVLFSTTDTLEEDCGTVGCPVPQMQIIIILVIIFVAYLISFGENKDEVKQ